MLFKMNKNLYYNVNYVINTNKYVMMHGKLVNNKYYDFL